MSLLGLIFGAVVGLSLGLTGGGGAIFAVPLLVYGLGVPAREAVGISLAAVGMTSLAGFLHRWRLGQVELHTGLIFAIAGMLGAPIGAWIGKSLPDAVLLTLFAGMMLIVAVRMWRQATVSAVRPEAADGPTCRRDVHGRLILSSRCAVLLLILGVATGVLAGLFGVGGGIVIVPALVLFSGMGIQQAIGTSLMVITLVSASGVASQLWAGQPLPFELTALFVGGGIGGLFVGQQIGRRLSGPSLQRVFAVAILLVATFVVVRNLNS